MFMSTGNREVNSSGAVEFFQTRERYSVLLSITQHFAFRDSRTFSPVTVKMIYLSCFDCDCTLSFLALHNYMYVCTRVCSILYHLIAVVWFLIFSVNYVCHVCHFQIRWCFISFIELSVLMVKSRDPTDQILFHGYFIYKTVVIF